ncbi:hypothetical protein J7U46_15425 [Pelomonas sp. V22]|uniref:hypothetical protein n=1 Tax=Pelomonas sp. V22 TaxID=2822139 RepID=UPI0024A7E632|nr:hypothetical protein [Pelomonas sp. V22]MDI4634449.1 hypothetical protein [Pelomonas sp. V22]
MGFLTKKTLAVGAACVLAAGLGALAWQGPADPADPVLPAEARAASAALPALASVPTQADAASATASAATPGQLAASGALPAVAALKALKQCYYADNCGLAGPEGLEAHFAASRAIVAQLKALPKEASPSEQAALAREFLAFPEGHVQAEALALAARLPPDAATVNAAVAALRESYDSVLFRQAFPILQQWQQQGLSAGYEDMLAEVLHTGGWHAAQAVAENLTPFLNDSNLARFEAVRGQLAEGARKNALSHSLAQYRLQRSGG